MYRYTLRSRANSIRSRFFHSPAHPAVKMVGMKPTDVVPSAAVKFFGAGTAACIADLVTFPLDTAKVRLQVRHTRCLWWPQILQHRVRHSVSL